MDARTCRRALAERRPFAAWRTHLYIAVIALLTTDVGFGQSSPRELLNSERIAATFGDYGIEVLAQDDAVRVSSLFSRTGAQKVCRTFAIVRYAASIDPVLGAEHAEILAGGSIGAVFAASGWEVHKTHLSYAVRPATERLAELMRIDVGVSLAEHIYVLDVVKEGRTFQYAALVEIHHPDYLEVDDLARIYGPLHRGQRELAESLRATAAERVR